MPISENAQKILEEKQYFQEEESSWEDICKRVAFAIADAEETDELKSKIRQEIYEAMTNLDFIFSTPCLINANKNNPGQLSSCFVADTRDTIEDICRMDAEFAKIFQRNGGVGTDLSVLRPAQTQVETSKGYAGGVITFMHKYDATADEMTKFNPSRKGAIKINLQCWHPQIKDFIHCKDDLTKLQRMNISVSFTDEFMNAVENDLDWNLEFPDYSCNKEIYNKEWNGNLELWKSKGYPIKVYETVKARELLKEFAQSSWNTGEPGGNYQTRMNLDNMNPHLSLEIYTNPCNEFTNIPYSSCNLGSINLSNCVENGKFNWTKLKDLTAKAVRWLDDMITINKLPLDKIDEITKEIRPIGMGLMGLSDAMYKQGIRYNSQDGYNFAEKVIKTMKKTAIDTSIELAKERGKYPAWEGSKWQEKGIEIRNSSLLSIAPNGTLSIIADVSGGCEPTFALSYSRRTYDGNLYYMTNEIFKEELEKRNIYSDELMEKIEKNHGSCQGISEIPIDIQNIFVTAHDLTPQEHIDMVAVLQKYVDLSLSKTVNFSNNATVEDIYNIYIYAWQKNLKGMSIYRDGCRENQTLATFRLEEKNGEDNLFDSIEPITKEYLGETYGSSIKKKIACGSLHINLFRDKSGNLAEIFVSTSKGGVCQSNINAVSRLISLALRSGVKVEEICEQITNIKCPACTVLKAKGEDVQGLSCPDAIGRYVLEKYHQGDTVIKEHKPKIKKKQNKVVDKNICPNCGSKMKSESGCYSCPNCSFSRCG